MGKKCIFCNNTTLTEVYHGFSFCLYHLDLFKRGLISISNDNAIISVRNSDFDYENIKLSITESKYKSNLFFDNHFKNIFQNALTEIEGKNLRVNNLHQVLDYLINNASDIYINVSFIRNTGLNLILKQLKDAKENGAQVSIITSTYMNITESSALLRIVDEFDVSLYSKSNSFHPKCYFFKLKNGETITIVGSSNISMSALKSGVEWNYIYSGQEELFLEEFYKLKENFTTVLTRKIIEEYANKTMPLKVFEEYDKTSEVDTSIYPRGFQIEALEKLKETRKMGQTRGVIIAATGLGKTYLAAFDALNFKRTLFVSHRAEILNSAYNSFKNVHGTSKSYGRIYDGTKEYDRDLIFATPQSLRKSTLDLFDRTYFDYIVIDEFHHASAMTYERIINYFNPKFLLGLTATPTRMDGADILKICDDNKVCDFNLFIGIKNNWLVPFNYYAVFDTTNYEDVKITSSGIIEDDVSGDLFNNENYENTIVSTFKEYHRGKSLVFCASKVHASQVASYMNKQNINAIALTSDNSIEERSSAITQLRNGEIDCITSVDLFNEGVDIPELNSIFMLRQTASPTIFFQQLGRGLRLSENKKKLVVVDLIGNHKNIDKKFSFLHGFKEQMQAILPETDYNAPDININFDLRLVNLKQNWEQKNITTLISNPDTFKSLYLDENENRIPSIYDYYVSLNDMEKDKFLSQEYKFQRSNFYDTMNNVLNEIEIELLNTIVTTSMQKIYKIPLLLSFLEDNKLLNVTTIDRNNITIDNLLLQHKYLFTNENLNQRKNCFDQPKKACIKTHSKFFEVKNIDNIEYFKFKDDIFSMLSTNFVSIYKDTIMFRAIAYQKKGVKNDK